MSAFLVAKRTIDKTVWLFRDNLSTTEQAQSLGQRLWNMNQEALRQRYGDDGPAPTYQRGSNGFHRLEALKGLQCLLYQCSEGNVPETWKEYELLRDKERSVMADIIGDMCEYKAASWE